MAGAVTVVGCLNAGSSSVKFALYECSEGTESLVVRGAVEQIGQPDGRMWVAGADGMISHDRPCAHQDHGEAVHTALAALAADDRPTPAAIGHRVVHGGPDHTEAALVDDKLVADLDGLVPFAPLHLPAALAGIDAVSSARPGLVQVACFDTAFHRRMPALAQRLPLPDWVWDAGVRRYGFHGLSYEYVLTRLPPDGRTVIAHLGSGASMAAIRDRQPVDTTMGLTPTGGFPMATRSGDLDPGVLLWLLREGRYDADRLEQLVDREAGLLGLSGSTGDVRTLLAARDHDERAAFALDLYCYQLAKHIGALTATLGGLDTLVFTGGVGEHAAPVRRQACAMLGHLGVELDDGANDAHADVISAPGSRCTVRIVATDEDVMIARHTRDLLGGS